MLAVGLGCCCFLEAAACVLRPALARAAPLGGFGGSGFTLTTTLCAKILSIDAE